MFVLLGDRKLQYTPEGCHIVPYLQLPWHVLGTHLICSLEFGALTSQPLQIEVCVCYGGGICSHPQETVRGCCLCVMYNPKP